MLHFPRELSSRIRSAPLVVRSAKATPQATSGHNELLVCVFLAGILLYFSVSM